MCLPLINNILPKPIATMNPNRAFGTQMAPFPPSSTGTSSRPLYNPPGSNTSTSTAASGTGFQKANTFFSPSFTPASSAFPSGTTVAGTRPINSWAQPFSSIGSATTSSSFPASSGYGTSTGYGTGFVSASAFRPASTGFPAVSSSMQGQPQSMMSDVPTGYSSGGYRPPSSTHVAPARYGTHEVRFVKTKDPESTDYFVHFLAMSDYQGTDKSPDECRMEDYALRKAGHLRFSARPAAGYYASTSAGFSAPSGMGFPRPADNTSLKPGTNVFAAGGSVTPSGFSSGFPAPSAANTSPWTSAPQPSTGFFYRPPSGFPSSSASATPGFPSVSTGFTSPASPFPIPTASNAGFAPAAAFPAPAFQTPFPSPAFSDPARPFVGFAQSQAYPPPPLHPLGPASAPAGFYPAPASQGAPQPGFTPLVPVNQPRPEQPCGYFPSPRPPSVLDPRQIPNAATNLALLGEDIMRRQSALYQPDYTDPYGLKSFLTATKESLQFERKIMGDLLPSATPYDHEDILRAKVPSRESYIRQTVLAGASKTGGEYPEQNPLYSYKTPAAAANAYPLGEKVKKSREQLKRLNLKSGPATVVRPQKAKMQKEATEQKYDENTLMLHVSANVKGEEMIVRVQIHKSYKVKDVKDEALAKLKAVLKGDKAKCARLLKGSNLLQEDDTLDDAHLADNDRLFLIIDKSADDPESDSDKEDEDITNVPAEGKPEPQKKRQTELADEKLVPKLTKAGYKTVPEQMKLYRMTEAELRKVTDFTVQNEWGKIVFEGETDVTGVDLDAVVSINPQEIVVYPDDKSKPPVGQKLNKPAKIHLYKCRPKSVDGKSGEKFLKKLKAASEKQDAEFVGYDPVEGEWTFRVKHFTKYGLEGAMEDDTEEEEEEAKNEAGPTVEAEADQSRKMSEVVVAAETAKEEEKAKLFATPFPRPGGLAEIKEEAKEFSAEEGEHLQSAHPQPEARSGMFNIIEEEAESPKDSVSATGEEQQLIKRRRPDAGPEGITSPPIKAFVFEPEAEPQEAFPMEPLEASKYIRVPVNYEAVKKCEDLVEKAGKEFRPVRLGQSFRVAWRRDGTFVRVAGVSDKKGTFELAVHQLQVHKSIPAEESPKYTETSYDSLLKTICDSLVPDTVASPTKPATFGLSASAIPQLWKSFVKTLVDAESKAEGSAGIETKEKLHTEAEVWALVNSLFGDPQVDLAGYLQTRRFVEYKTRRKLSETEINYLRKNLLSNWLRCTISKGTESEIEMEPPQETSNKKSQYGRIENALSRGDVEAAVKACSMVGSGNQKPLFALGSLVANAAMSGERVKEMIRAQFKQWEMSGVKDHIDPQIVKLYETLVDSRKHSQGYEWRRQLGMYMWYDCPPEMPIREVFTSFKVADPNSLVPKYVREGPAENHQKTTDLCYSLIGAYTNVKQFPLEAVLDPKGYTADHLEKRVVWLMYHTLKTLLKSKGTVSGMDLVEVRSAWRENKRFGAEITSKFMEELEQLGYWHWAVMVCLMSKDVYEPDTITHKVEQIIARNVEDLVKSGDSITPKERILTDVLKVPMSILKHAKGVFYMSQQDWPRALKSMEEAHEWAVTHQLLWENVAPCVVAKKGIPATAIAIVKTLLGTLSVHKNVIPDWNSRGGMLQKFLEIVARAKEPKRPAEVMEEIKKVLQMIGGGRDGIVLGKVVEKLKKIAAKIQKRYHEEMLRGAKSAGTGDEGEMKEVVPVPFKARGAAGVDKKILEEEITHMIYRASKSGTGGQIME